MIMAFLLIGNVEGAARSFSAPTTIGSRKGEKGARRLLELRELLLKSRPRSSNSRRAPFSPFSLFSLFTEKLSSTICVRVFFQGFGWTPQERTDAVESDWEAFGGGGHSCVQCASPPRPESSLHFEVRPPAVCQRAGLRSSQAPRTTFRRG